MTARTALSTIFDVTVICHFTKLRVGNVPKSLRMQNAHKNFFGVLLQNVATKQETIKILKLCMLRLFIKFSVARYIVSVRKVMGY